MFNRLLAACLFAITSVLYAEIPADSLLFHATFDHGKNADVAEGDATATAAIEPEFRPGISGQALLIGGLPGEEQEIVNGIPVVRKAGRNLAYAPEGNFDFAQGTLAFWLKPLDWDADTRGFNVVFQTQAGGQFFQLYKFFSNERFNFIRGPAPAGFTGAKYEMGTWQQDQWQHIAATWNSDELRLYVNGSLVCSRQIRVSDPKTTPVKPICIGPGNDWDKAYIGHSLMDDVRIYDRPLSQAAIIDIYRIHADQANRDTDHLTVGTTVPQVDGDIAPWDYAFTGSGWSDITTGMVAKRQPTYHLSADTTHLTLGLESDLVGERNEAVLHVLTDKLRTITITPATARATHTIADGRWTFEIRIPLAELGITADTPTRFNLARVWSDLTATIAPTVGSTDDRSNFLVLRLDSDAPQVHIPSIYDMAKHESAIHYAARADDSDTTIYAREITDTTEAYGLRTRKRLLFENGTNTPHTAPEPPRKPWALQDFSLHTLAIVAERGETSRELFHRQFIYETSAPLQVNFLYVQAKKRLFVSAMARQSGQLRVRFAHKDEGQVWQTTQAIPEGARYFSLTFPLDYAQLPPADYVLYVDHLAADGNATEVWWQDLQVPSVDTPILQPYVDPEADIVPKPWTPLQVSDTSVSMWGRTYAFGEGILFGSLESQGHEIMAAPAQLTLAGKALTPSTTTAVLTAASDMTTSLTKTADLGLVRTSSTITTHFDGYCEIALTITPAADSLDIPTLSLDIPLRSEHATLVRDNQLSPLMGSKAGAVGDYWHQKLVDGPWFWVGSEQAGFNWLAPDLSQWHVKDHSKNVEIIREGDTTLVRLNLVDTPLQLTGPRTFRFGFAVTPTRPVDPTILRQRVGKDFEKWCQPWEYFGILDYETADIGKIKWRSRNVDEIFLYQGDSLTSPFSPEWAFWEEEWRPLSRRGRGYGTWTGNLAARPFACYTGGCLRSQTFRNFIQHMRAEFYEKAKTPLTEKATSYYFDTGIGVSMCTNHHHGCSTWTDLDGRQHGTLAIHEKRQLQLNVYRMIKRTGPNAKSMTHEGWYRAMPMQHFSDIMIGGEGVENMVSSTGNYYQVVNPEMFRATWLHQIWGMKTAWLNMLVRAAANSPEKHLAFATDPDAQHATRHFYGYCLTHDVDTWDTAKETAAVRETVWDTQDILGWDTDIRFYGYWQPDTPVTQTAPGSSRVLASAYTKDGKLLLAILNDTDESQDIGLALDLETLGVAAGLKGHDVFDTDTTFTLADSYITTIPARGFRLIVFQP